MSPPEAYDAVVLAGGRNRRMAGRDKCAEVVAGQTLLDRALAAVADARHTVVVGPRRPTRRVVQWTREEPIGGGPAAAVAAGLAELEPAGTVIVIAGDLPFAAGVVDSLVSRLATTDDADAVVAVDNAGRDQYLLGAYDAAALRRALQNCDVDGAAMKSVVAQLRVARLAVAGDQTLDCDTPEDLSRARAIASTGES